MALSPMVKKGLGHAVGVPVAAVIYVTVASATISALMPFLTGMVAAGSDDIYGVDGTQWAAWMLQFGIAFCGGVGAGLLALIVKLYGLYARWLDREVNESAMVSPMGTARRTQPNPEQPTERTPRRVFTVFDVLAKKRSAGRSLGMHEDTEDVAEATKEATSDSTPADTSETASHREVIDGEELADILALEELDSAPPAQMDTDQADSDVHNAPVDNNDTNKDTPNGKPIQ